MHDYHLMLCPAMIRQALPDAKIGFFLHTPFPTSELFKVLPRKYCTNPPMHPENKRVIPMHLSK